MIRLAAFDLDQTLIGDDLQISPGVQRAIQQAQALGTTVTIVTGRNTFVTEQFARQLGLHAPIVCMQGGMVYDFLQARTLYEIRLPEDLLPIIVHSAQRLGWNLHFEASNCVYMPRHSNHPKILYELLRVSEWTELDDMLNDLPEIPHKFIVTLNQPDENERALRVMEMKSIFDGRLHIVPSHPYLIEGVPVEVDKGRGLAWLANYLGIPVEQVMAVGDNDNDVPMIRWAGVGVAVGNASPEAKAAADWIAPRLDQDAAAAAIQRYILDR